MLEAERTIEVETRGAVEILTLNRPASLNALNSVLVAELNDYFEGLHSRPEVRVVLMCGAGRAICAGADLKEPGTKEARVHTTLKRQRSVGRIVRLMRSCPQPINGLGHGPAAGVVSPSFLPAMPSMKRRS